MNIQADAIYKLHRKKCPSYDPSTNVQLSLDGVSEAKSNSVSLDVYSLHFENCKNVYPHTILRPIHKDSFDKYKELDTFILNVIDQGNQISKFIADNPKRAFVRHSLSHSGTFPCEYCNARGVHCPDTDGKKNNDMQARRSALEANIKLLIEKPGTPQEK